MRTIFKNKLISKLDLKEANETVSTLLIPAGLMNVLDEYSFKKVTKLGVKIDLKKTLNHFIEKYRSFFESGELEFTNKPKLSYQKENQDLQVFKFRPDNADWLELGIIAYTLGVSRCKLFSYLLEFEARGLGEFFGIVSILNTGKGVATLASSQSRGIWQISSRRQSFYRILHFRP